MANFGTTEEEFKQIIAETEKALGRKLTPEEIENLKKCSE